MNGSVFSLISILPPASFVMGRRVNPVSPREAQEKGLEVTPEVLGCHFCGKTDHEIATLGSANAVLVFLSDLNSRALVSEPLAPFFMKSPEGQLFEKIREATRLSPNQTAHWVRRESGLGETQSVCAALQLKELKQGGTKVLIALGESMGRSVLGTNQGLSEMRGHIHDRHELKVLVTESLSGMLENPNLKKQAWEELKLGLQALRE